MQIDCVLLKEAWRMEGFEGNSDYHLLLESVNTLIIRIILGLNCGEDDLLIDFRTILHDDSLQCLKW